MGSGERFTLVGIGARSVDIAMFSRVNRANIYLIRHSDHQVVGFAVDRSENYSMQGDVFRVSQ